MIRRYGCVRQAGSGDGAAASLATILQHYRRAPNVERLRALAATGQIGPGLPGLAQAAEQLGISARAMTLSLEAIQSAPLPAIAALKSADGQERFVVVHRLARSSVVIADPQAGVCRMPLGEFAAVWTGRMLLVAPADFPLGQDSTAAATSALRRFVGLLSAQRALLVEAAACAAMAALLGLASCFFVRYLIDVALGHNELGLLKAIGIGWVAILLFRSAFGLLRSYLLAHLGRKIELSLMADYSRRLLAMPLESIQSQSSGELLARGGDVGKIRDGVANIAITATIDNAVVFATLGLCWSFDPSLALVATVLIALLLVVSLILAPFINRNTCKTSQLESRLAAQLSETIQGAETFKSLSLDRQRTAASESQIVGLGNAHFSKQLFTIGIRGLGALLLGLGVAGILLLGSARVAAGTMSLGQLIFFATLFAYLFEPLLRIAALSVQIPEALVALDRLALVLDAPSESNDLRGASFNGIRAGLEFKNVTFAHRGRAALFTDLNMQIPAGAMAAIVGESGCGKSTLLKLISRLYEPAAGQILIDGIDLRDFQLASLRQGVAVVAQDPFLIQGTLRDNLTLGNPSASVTDLVVATNIAGLREWIARLPQRYEMQITERGANLAAGERQRIAIARAILCRPALLLLDEATNQLDTAAELTLLRALRTALPQTTILLATHRLSAARRAELICVVNEGRIVEQGTPARLLADGGKYSQWWRSQADGSITRRPTGALISSPAPQSNPPAIQGH